MHIIVLGGAGAMGRVTVRTLLVAPYSIRTILDEFTKQPQVFQDGNWYLQQPLSGQEEMVFPLPVGRYVRGCDKITLRCR